MKTVNIQFEFEDYKLEALKFFLESKGEKLVLSSIFRKFP